MRSEKEKEKTKMRERERRAITTNIFRGLRKHSNYPLTPRADINQVLRHLAAEAGWVVEPDGTTYRASTSILHIGSTCLLCGSSRTSTNPTPTSSAVVNCRAGDGECSKPLSPQNPSSFLDSTVANANVNVNNSNQLPICSNYGGPSHLN